MGAQLYILRCADGSYYVGTTRGSLDLRLAQHQDGTFGGYTSARGPSTLVFQQYFERIEDAVTGERQVKGWRREKKEALIRGDLAALPVLSRRAGASRRAPGSAAGAPQHEEKWSMHPRTLTLRSRRKDGVSKGPHAEEAAKRPSRSTHDPDPA